jgi:hypothetical protein
MLREVHRLIPFEEKVPRRIFGSKGVEEMKLQEAGKNCSVRNCICAFCQNLLGLSNQVAEMSKVCSTHVSVKYVKTGWKS